MRLIDKYKLPELFWSTVPAMAHLAFEEFGSHSRLIEFYGCFASSFYQNNKNGNFHPILPLTIDECSYGKLCRRNVKMFRKSKKRQE